MASGRHLALVVWSAWAGVVGLDWSLGMVLTASNAITINRPRHQVRSRRLSPMAMTLARLPSKERLFLAISGNTHEPMSTQRTSRGRLAGEEPK